MLTPAEKNFAQQAIQKGYCTQYQLQNAAELLASFSIPGQPRQRFDQFVVGQGLLTEAQAEELRQAMAAAAQAAQPAAPVPATAPQPVVPKSVHAPGAPKPHTPGPTRAAAPARRRSSGQMGAAAGRRVPSGKQRRGSRASQSAMSRGRGGNNTALIAGGAAGGVLLLLILILVATSGGPPEEPRPKPKPRVTKKKTDVPEVVETPDTSTNPKLDAAMADMRSAVRKALDADAIDGAMDAISDFRFKLEDAKGDVTRYEEAAQTAERDVRSTGKRLFDRLADELERDGDDGASEKLATLRAINRAIDIGGGRLAVLERKLADPAPTRPIVSRPTPTPTPTGDDLFLVHDFSHNRNVGRSRGMTVAGKTYADDRRALLWTITGVDQWTMQLTQMPGRLDRYKTVRIQMRAHDKPMQVWVRLGFTTKNFASTSIASVGTEWKLYELPISGFRRTAGFRLDKVIGISFAGWNKPVDTVQKIEFARVELDTKPPGSRTTELPRDREATPSDPKPTPADPKPTPTDPKPKLKPTPEPPEPKPEIKVDPKREEDLSVPVGILVRKNGETFVGRIKQARGRYWDVPGEDVLFHPDNIAYYHEGKDKKAALKAWSGKLAKRPTASPEEWISVAKYTMYNKLSRKYVHQSLQAWKASRLRRDRNPWKFDITKHFVMLSDATDQRRRVYVQMLEGTLAKLGTILPAKTKPGLDFIVRVYSRYSDYGQETGSGGSVGLYMPNRRELAILDEAGYRKEAKEAIFHEVTHQYMNEYFNGYSTDVHWYEEGMAEFFNSAKFKGGKVYNIGAKMSNHLMRLRLKIKQEGGLKLHRLWEITYSSFYNDRYKDAYPASWALVHFFINTRNPTYRKAWRKWVKEQPNYDKTTIKKLFKASIGGLDITKVERDVIAYIKAFP